MTADMKQGANKNSGADIHEARNHLKKLGERAGRKFLRMIFYEDDKLEIEFQAKNSWECMVVTFEHWGEFLPWLEQTLEVNQRFKDAVIQKKCAKCFLHQREVSAADL